MKQITSPAVRKSILFVIWIVALLALGSAPPPAQPVQAATCSVTGNADSGAGTLRALLADTSCDTITFAGDATIRLASPLSPTRSVTVDGGTHRVILSGDNTGDGTGDTRLFSIPGGLAVTLNNLNLETGRAYQAQGGAIENYGTLTVANSILSGNSSNWGGAIYSSGGALTVTNSTFVTNNAGADGGAIYNLNGLLTVKNCTFAGNSASAQGGAIYNLGATAAVYNSVLRKGSASANCSISASTAANNLADDASCGTGFTQVEPAATLLGSLGDYSGSTQTIPLLPGSPAIDAGSSTYCPTTDQRGIARPQGAGCDIGAFESQGFMLAVSGGDNQAAPIFAAFAAPLEVTVSSAHGEPVEGGVVAFAAPASGAMAQLSAGSATLSGGKAGVSATANNTSGSYKVTASARGANSVSFSLTNSCPSPLVVTSNADDGPGTLRALVAATCTEVITFAGDTTIRLQSQISFSHDVTVDGGTHQVTISGDSNGDGTGDIRLFWVPSGVTVGLNNLTLVKGYATRDGGGGIYSQGDLTVADCVFSDNSIGYGWNGGAIYAEDSGQLTVTGSTFTRNSSGSNGGAIDVFNLPALTVSNSTFFDNHANSVAGALSVWVRWVEPGTAVVANSTFAGNSATNYASTIDVYGTALHLANTIVSGSSVLASCIGYSGGTIIDDGGNLGYPDASCPGIHADPLLGPYQNNGGLTPTMVPGFSSPAMDAANDATCAAPPVNNLDQRGVTRPQGQHCDIGAVEVTGDDNVQSGPTFTVTSTAWTTDHNCAQNCTLREAIEAANKDGVDSTIELSPGAVYAIQGVDNTESSVAPTEGPNGLPRIQTPIIINGHGATITRSDGAPNARLFYVDWSGSLTLNEVQLLKGRLDSSIYTGDTQCAGGAILSWGRLIVKRSYLAQNDAYFGSALHNRGTASIYNSTFYANTAHEGAIDGYGVLDLYSSTLFDNTGVNTADISLSYTSSSQFNLYNNVFASSGSTVELCALGVPASMLHMGGNLATDSSCNSTTTSYAAIKAVAPPDYNGGLTKNMAIQAGSSAIDVGNATACQNANINNRDQRGYARFVDGNGDKVASCDIGAFEYGASGPPAAILDTEPPVVTLELTPAEPDGANGWYRSPVTVKPDVTDASPVIELRCALDPAEPPAAFDDLPEDVCPFLGGAPVGAHGEHTFYAAAVDIWGNKSTPVSAAFRIAALTSLEVTVNREQAYTGAILEYNLMVRNLTGVAQKFAVSDPIPENTEIVRRINYNPATNAVEWSGVLEPWGFKTFTVYVRIVSGTPGGTAIVNTATIQDDAASGSASATTIVKTLPPYRGHRADVDVNEVVIRGN